MIPDFVIGNDLGWANDPSCLAVLSRRPLPVWITGENDAVILDANRRPTQKSRETFHGNGYSSHEYLYEDHFVLGHLERFDLRTAYGEVALRARDLVKMCPGVTALVVDASGVGRPVIEMMRDAGLSPVAITSTGGQKVRHDWQTGINVPKKLLVSNLRALLEQGRIRWPADLPLLKTFEHELRTFKGKETASGGETAAAEQSRGHDDLVMAVALAAWEMKRVPTGWSKYPAVGGFGPPAVPPKPKVADDPEAAHMVKLLQESAIARARGSDSDW